VRGVLDGKKLKFLYLLALFQLVAGPLVLLQVTVFCKLTIPEVPRQGLVIAAQKTWKTQEFQATLHLADHAAKEDSKSPLPTSDPPSKSLKASLPLIAWTAPPLPAVQATGLVPCSDWSRMWTPTWPQAPPAPPPRIG
jgi:hypothetical protein